MAKTANNALLSHSSQSAATLFNCLSDLIFVPFRPAFSV
jgi:hypothetical protein